MKKSGLIIGGIALVFSLAVTLLSPFLLPCITPILGVAAGYMAGVFDFPSAKKDVIKLAAKAGVLGGIGMLVGQVMGALINGFLVGPEGAAIVMNSWGLPVGGPRQIENIYWTALVVSTACISILNIAIMAGLGALGGLLWWQIIGKENIAKMEIVENIEE